MTQGKHPDRYVVRELTGYDGSNCHAKETTDVYLVDSWDGYAIVWSAQQYQRGKRGVTLDERRLEARARCNHLNEEHRRLIHAGRWSQPAG